MFKRKKVTFHCKLPEVLETYPILPAKNVKFDWLRQSSLSYKKMLEERGRKESIAGTVKCPGMINIMQKGWILQSWFDLTIITHENETDRFQFSLPSDIDSYLKDCDWNKGLISWFSESEPALRIPTAQNDLHTLIKISTPWTVEVPEGKSLFMFPIPYPDEAEFSAVHGILESGKFYDINAIIKVHKRPGELFIPAGTPLCQMIVIDDRDDDIVQNLQTEKNRMEELKTRFRVTHRFSTNSKR